MIFHLKSKFFLIFLRPIFLNKYKAAFFLFLFVLIGITVIFSFNFISAKEKIDINTASEEELQIITGVGPVLAQRIINARPFSSVNDLIKVGGIGEITLQKIIDQGLAWVSEDFQKLDFQQGQDYSDGSKIILSYPENNPSNSEIEVFFSVSNLKNTVYDLKISIEKEKVISDIYNENENKWQSSHYYINSLFSGDSFEGTFKLKIKERDINFRGETDIIVRVRENGKTNYSEYKDKINITAPEQAEIKNLTAVGRSSSRPPMPFRISLIALILSAFSGVTILSLKKNCKKNKIC